MAFYLENETITYDDNFTILDSLNFSIKKGSKLALLGKSGSGKSTLLKFLLSQKIDEISYIPQDLSLVQNLSVFHNIYTSKIDEHSIFYNLRNLIIPYKHELKNIKYILKKFDLEDKILDTCNKLSGGQQQRVAISRAIYKNKNILLADEPIASLDEYMSQKVLKTLIQEFETVVCAIHNVPLAIQYFDRVIGLKNGQILVDKACNELTDDDIQKLYYVCD